MPFELYVVLIIVIILAVAVFFVWRAWFKSAGLIGGVNSTPVGDENWTASMGWRYVRYTENGASVTMQIEPMAYDADLVYVPDETSWPENAPRWAQDRRVEILERLKSVAWNRELTWQEGGKSLGGENVIPGTLESTFGGKKLEKRRLFHPGGNLTPDEAREFWHNAARTFAQMAKGKVHIIKDKGVPGSVFEEIEIPVLELNPNVELIFIKPE